MNDIEFYKKGNKIYIKKKNRGKFTDYCGGKVTDECIQRGKNSPNPKIRKRATFAANARVWKHQQGGTVKNIADNLFENLKEVKYGNGNYDNVNTKLFSKYPPQANGHRDDRVKLVNHPSHPSRGKWSNNNKVFNLSDFGMENPNLTFFGLADGNDPNAVLKYKNDYVLPEITVTPHGAYVDNTYDQIRLYPKTNVQKHQLGGVIKLVPKGNYLKVLQQFIEKTKISPKNMLNFRKGIDRDDRFLQGELLKQALEKQKVPLHYVGHGMSKQMDQEALATARMMNKHGYDTSRKFYSSSLVGDRTSTAAPGGFYSDGPFIIVRDMRQPEEYISHILINDSYNNPYSRKLANFYKSVLDQENPNIPHVLFSDIINGSYKF